MLSIRFPQLKKGELNKRIFETAVVRLLLIGFAAVALFVSHWVLLRWWRSIPKLGSMGLPALLVFPRLELLYWDMTFVPVAESFSMLIASE